MTKQIKSRPQNIRRSRTIRGRGDYTSDVVEILKPLPRLEAKIDHLERMINPKSATKSKAASVIGRTLGNFVNQGDIGALAGESLAKFFGHGDYTLKSNSLMMSQHSGSTVPKFSSNGKRGTRIVERELLMDLRSGPTVLSGSTTFDNRSFRINPTDRNTFPWLNTIANQFDQWEPHGIVFEFISTSSSYNGTSQALGAVIMSTDYDPTDAPYTSKPQMENADYSCSTRPAENLMHGIECEPRERPTPILYTSSTTVPFATLGNFQVATQGCSTAGVTLGELWVSYDITFYKKQVFSLANTLFAYSSTGLSYSAGPILGAQTSVTTNSGDFTYSVQVGVGSTITFPRNAVGLHFLVNLTLDGSVNESLSPVYAGCTLLSQSISTINIGTEIVTATFLVTSSTASLSFGMKVVNNGTFSLKITECPDTL